MIIILSTCFVYDVKTLLSANTGLFFPIFSMSQLIQYTRKNDLQSFQIDRIIDSSRKRSYLESLKCINLMVKTFLYADDCKDPKIKVGPDEKCCDI